MLDKTDSPVPGFDFSEDPELAWTLPGFTYFDPAWFDRERRLIFRKSWRWVGHVSDIASPGDYLTATIVDQPVVVIRSKDGSIRAFHNVCKHRAHILLPEPRGSLNASLITCPYHAWAYDMEGALKAVPHCDLIKGFDRSSVRLDALKVEEVMGFIFINPDLQAAELGPQIEYGLGRLKAHCPGIEDYRAAVEVTFDIAANWKNVGDNLLECYHCHPAHKAFVDLVDMDTYSVENGGCWSWQSGTCRPHSSAYRIPEELSDLQREFVTFYVWPDMSFTRFAGSDNMAIFSFEAVAPELTHQRFAIYSPGGKLDSVGQSIHRYFAEVLGPEDVSLVENVQKGLHSMSYDRGRFMIDAQRSYFSEHALHHFHSLVLKALAGEE